MNNAIFVAFDNNHWHHFIHLYNSLQENYPDHPILLVHFAGWNPDMIEWLKAQKDIRFYPTRDLTINLVSPGYHKAVPSKMVYYKYLLWTNNYDEYDNILHLDVDTLVLSPLDELFEKDDFFVVANNIPFKEVRILPPDKENKSTIESYLKRHHIRQPEHEDMVNAGVFLIPKSYRKKGYLESIVNITNDFGKLLVYADQSALSLWCIKHGITPSEEYQYNLQPPIFNKFYTRRYKKVLNTGLVFNKNKNVLDNIKIVHFSGPIKPNIRKFTTWRLMGRYAWTFKYLYDKYMGVRL
jgi:lipopolysaccharide biosynthesis glycosyltransferase